MNGQRSELTKTSMNNVKVRYGPSPTGTPHVGNIRTALFNYLLAKNLHGKFYLRIEDTDQKRIEKGAVEKIKESLELLGLTWDSEIIYQSKRLDIYKEHLEILKSRGLVYEDENAWRFKINTNEEKENWQDLVHGHVSFPTKVLEDFIIIKSDGYPTYHFASVVDDHLMEISHVLRGDEWISSTPKHLQLYKAFGWVSPNFVHLPVILGPDKKKLSKRDGAKTVHEYLDDGYLPQALINFLALLGWSPKSEQELFSLDQLSKEFSLDRINKNSPIFNLEKLNWFNNQWIKELDSKQFSQEISAKFPGKYDQNTLMEIAPLVKSRMTTIKDFTRIADPFFKDPNIGIDEIKNAPLSGRVIKAYSQTLNNLNQWTAQNIQTATINFCDENKVDKRDLYRCLGIATFASLITPPLPESINVIGKDKTIKRLNDLAEKKK